MVDAHEALSLLKKGNNAFHSNAEFSIKIDKKLRSELAIAQKPIAIILGCSDSRVPAEIIFNQSLGELFVIRVAGNIVAPSQIGSIEFATETFGTKLVVVLGHSGCGAVSATIDQLKKPMLNRSKNLRSIVDRIAPAIKPIMDKYEGDELLDVAVRKNIFATAENLRHGSDILENQIQNEGLLIISAHYCLESGEVEFFESI